MSDESDSLSDQGSELEAEEVWREDERVRNLKSTKAATKSQSAELTREEVSRVVALMELLRPEDCILGTPYRKLESLSNQLSDRAARWHLTETAELRRENAELWSVLESISTHYSGSLDNRPFYVMRARKLLEHRKP